MRYDVSKHNSERVIALPDDEIAARYVSGETIKELAHAYAVSRPTIAKSLDRKGVLRRPAVVRPGRGIGSANPAWKGGRRIRRDGYIVVWTPDGDILEHRKIMQDHLGRLLSPEEIVHHKDGNKQNNEISNLELMTQNQHARHHAPEMHAARYGYDR
jgi:hypothetical protein